MSRIKVKSGAENVHDKHHRVKLSTGDKIFNIVNYSVFTLLTIACLFPFYYLFINTISDNELVRLGYIQLYPRGIHFQNYVEVMKIGGILDALLVSVARTVLGTVWTVGGSAMLGYLVTKQEMWLRKVWYRLIVITMYFSAGLIPWYMNLRMLGFLDNFWVYVIPGLVSPYNVILVKTFIEALPPSLEESATLDGAGYMRVFLNVIIRSDTKGTRMKVRSASLMFSTIMKMTSQMKIKRIAKRLQNTSAMKSLMYLVS